MREGAQQERAPVLLSYASGRHWAGPNVQTLAEFEKIRVVGKGAYGSAVLYRKVPCLYAPLPYAHTHNSPPLLTPSHTSFV